MKVSLLSDMGQRSVFAVLWMLLSAVTDGAAEDKVYFGRDGELVLRPPDSAAITNIVWKLNNNLVADWENQGNPTYFGPFKGRTNLDQKSGVLTLKPATVEDQGLFTVEINDRVQDVRYSAIMIATVPAPVVGITPLVCDAHEDSCTANCGVKEGEQTDPAEPITYSWKKDDGDWETGSRELPITKAEVINVQNFFCRMKNPISQKDSEAKKNPLYVPSPDPVPPYWIIVVVLVIVGVGVVMVVLWKTKPQFLTNLMNRNESGPAKNSASNNPSSPEPHNNEVLLSGTGENQGNGSEAV